jgi:hypothetical protein
LPLPNSTASVAPLIVPALVTAPAAPAILMPYLPPEISAAVPVLATLPPALR